MKVPRRVTMREVWMEMNGTLEGTEDFTVENAALLYIWSHANTLGAPKGVIQLANLTIRAGGKAEALSAADGTARMTLNLTNLVINGRGYMRTNDIVINAENVTIDLSGLV